MTDDQQQQDQQNQGDQDQGQQGDQSWQSDQGRQGGSQQGQQGYDSSYDQQQGGLLLDQMQRDARTQSQFDSSFNQLIGTSASAGAQVALGTVDWVREYFDLAEQTIRSARRVAELQTIAIMRQEITADVTRTVLAQIAANPQVQQQLTKKSKRSKKG